MSGMGWVAPRWVAACQPTTGSDQPNQMLRLASKRQAGGRNVLDPEARNTPLQPPDSAGSATEQHQLIFDSGSQPSDHRYPPRITSMSNAAPLQMPIGRTPPIRGLDLPPDSPDSTYFGYSPAIGRRRRRRASDADGPEISNLKLAENQQVRRCLYPVLSRILITDPRRF